MRIDRDVAPRPWCLISDIHVELDRMIKARGLTLLRQELDALHAAADALAYMGCGTAEAVFSLCSIPPGGGKTMTMTAAFRTIVLNPDYSDIGGIVFLSRKDAIKELLSDLDLPVDKVAIVTGDPSLNALGGAETWKAPVLISTQQLLESLIQYQGKFSAMESYFYRGRPRAMRAWDERMSPRLPMTIDHLQVQALPERLRRLNSDYCTALDQLVGKIHAATHGDHVVVPAAIGNLPAFDLSAPEADRTAATRIRTLAALAGESVPVLKCGDFRYLAGMRTCVPPDLAPLLVFDASASHVETYRLANDSGVGFKWLKVAPKRYDRLKIHLLRRGGGKSTWKRDGQARIDAIAEAILNDGEEKFLVVHHKEETLDFPFESALRKALGGNIKRVKLITWGNERATNVFREYRRIVLAGTLFLPDAALYALCFAAMGCIDLDAAARVLRAVETGEQADGILQAVCRTNARHSANGVCGECEVYLIASDQSGIAPQLERIFPGCQVIPWEPGCLQSRPTQVSRALAFFQSAFGGRLSGYATLDQAMQAARVANRKDFAKRVLKDERIIECFKRNNVELHRDAKSGKLLGFNKPNRQNR